MGAGFIDESAGHSPIVVAYIDKLEKENEALKKAAKDSDYSFFVEERESWMKIALERKQENVELKKFVRAWYSANEEDKNLHDWAKKILISGE